MYEWLDERPELWPVAQDAFEMTAEMIGDNIVDAVELPEDGAVLDVGGGHALYSIAFCDRYPSLSATIFDDSAVLEIARKNTAAAGLTDQISFQYGDYGIDELGEGYDVALIFNVVHGTDSETNRTLFPKVSDAVSPGGKVVILDQFGDESRLSIANTGTRFLDLTYLVSLGGRTYATEIVCKWLSAAGFRLTERPKFQDRNRTLLVAEVA